MLIKSIKIKKMYVLIGILTFIILGIISFIIIKSIVLANDEQEEKKYIKYYL